MILFKKQEKEDFGFNDDAYDLSQPIDLKNSRAKAKKSNIFLFIGSSNKTDILLNLAFALTQIDKKILVVDATKNQLYKKGYIEFSQELYDFDGVDIATDLYSRDELNRIFEEFNEDFTSYDHIFVDIDQPEHLDSWGNHTGLFIGSEERISLSDDKQLLNAYSTIDESKLFCIYQTFQNALNDQEIEDLFSFQYDMPIHWANTPFVFEREDVDLMARHEMQYHLAFKIKHLSKTYKNNIALLISLLFGNHKKEILGALKRNQ